MRSAFTLLGALLPLMLSVTGCQDRTAIPHTVLDGAGKEPTQDAGTSPSGHSTELLSVELWGGNVAPTAPYEVQGAPGGSVMSIGFHLEDYSQVIITARAPGVEPILYWGDFSCLVEGCVLRKIRDTRGSGREDLRIHRSLLQPRATALIARQQVPRSVRE